MQSDVAAAAPIQASDDASFRPKSSLMKKLSFLLHPKKSKSKSATPSHQKPALPPPPSGPGSELELLFAQAEATLGELLIRAGASFEARSSSSYSHPDQHHHQPAPSVSNRSLPEEGVSARIMGSSSAAGSRSANFSGHVRRRSLSRVWQQLGGSLFCGSGHMNAYMMDRDILAPAPAPAPSKSIYDDVVLDEAYWQSVADAMLLEQQQHHQKSGKLAADDTPGEDELSRLHMSTAKEVQADDQLRPPLKEHNVVEHFHIAAEEEGDCTSEIKPSIVGNESMAKMPWLSPICGSSGRSSWQDMEYNNLVGAELSGGGCTRLNTTLDESPNLAHNYFVLKAGGTSSNSHRDTSEAVAQPSSSSSMQPLERFLWQARTGGAGPSILVSGSTSSPSSRSAPDLSTSQEPVGADTSATTNRVSLMALLHEETAAGEPITTLDCREEEEAEAAAAAALEGEGRRNTRSMRSTSTAGEDPLQCCVCMSRRKGAALIPCGHTFCRICAKHLFAGRGACPLCNNLIVQVLDIF